MTFADIQSNLLPLTSILAQKYKDKFAGSLDADHLEYVTDCDAAYMEGGPYFTAHHRTGMMTHISGVGHPSSQEFALITQNLTDWLYSIT
jgi:hypothetical protein